MLETTSDKGEVTIMATTFETINAIVARSKATLTFRLERETKNTVRYQEEGRVPIIGTLYVSKAALVGMVPADAPWPTTLTVTMEVK